MPGMTWDGAADSQLLLSILAYHEVKVDFNAVAALMGPQCTPRAVQERLKKLKKMAAETAGGTLPKAAPPKATNVAKGTTANVKGTKTTKAPASKKSRTNKATKMLRTDSTEPDSGNASDDGNLSDDEAIPKTNDKAKGHTKGSAIPANNLAKSILGAKRKLEDMNAEKNPDVAIKKEEVETGLESNQEEAQEEGSSRKEEDPTSEQLWNELTYGMNPI